MYLILSNSELLGYTYNKLAVIAFMRLVNKSKTPLDITIKKTSDSYPIKGIKTKEHLENLVNWYRRNGHDYYLWKYISYNRNIIPKFSYSFMGNFHKIMWDLQLDDLCNSLNEELNKYVLDY